MPQKLRHIRHWVFDLDNTLYHPSIRLFDQIEVKMRDYIVSNLQLTTEAADTLRDAYWRRYGTTLAGLMQEHDIDPDPFLEQVHDIDFSNLPKSDALAKAIEALPGRKIIYTNGTAPYARHVVNALGLAGQFDAFYGVEHAAYHPTPASQAYAIIFDGEDLQPTQAAMFDDDPRNLDVPHQLGLKTILVNTSQTGDTPHIDYQTDNLVQFLRQIV